jgi:PPK2 family polyphosphate:nucleotide phosphotransferase
MAQSAEQYRIKPGSKVHLAEWDPASTDGWTKKDALAEVTKLGARLAELQELLYATEKHALLVVLQGMDTSGKDGAIKHVMGAFNPQGCQVASFKVPTREELAHDFLWRIHKVIPQRGMVGIFNRSHYEDVLVVRVDALAPEPVWRSRYGAINAFEELLAASGVVVVKYYLHLSKEEQRQRLNDRLTNPHDQWKFRVGDLTARAKWDDYVCAYEDALEQCSTSHAPWHLIPADKKWYRNLLISQILVAKLEALEMEWPPLEAAAQGITVE